MEHFKTQLPAQRDVAFVWIIIIRAIKIDMHILDSAEAKSPSNRGQMWTNEGAVTFHELNPSTTRLDPP